MPSVIQSGIVGDKSHPVIKVGVVREDRWRSYICVIQKGAVGDRVIP